MDDRSVLKLEQSKNLSKLLGSMLKKKYSNFSSHRFSIDDILSWELWPTFLKMHGRSTGLHYYNQNTVLFTF